MSARMVNAVIRDYAAAGRTVVLSTHQMGLVEALCTRVLMIAHGRAVLYGSLRDIKRQHSSHAVRVLSSARYDACPLVLRVDGPSSDGQPTNVHLREDATSDQFLAWLVAHDASVERFEQLSTPLEDIFVGVVERAAGTV
jgi:ABC-2 type transport system ATP-binding protein